MSIERLIVAKIGGESQVTPEGCQAALCYLLSNLDIHYLVPSAIGGNPKVTELLIGCSPEWKETHPYNEIYRKVRSMYDSTDEIYAEVRRIYTSMGESLGYHGLGRELDVVEEIIEEAARSDSESERERCGYLIVSRGEWLSGHMWSELLGWRFVDPTEMLVLRKNDQFDERSYRSIGSRLRRGDRVVIPGFYGRDIDGAVRLFPRNGSDLTAAYIARGINASEYQNLKGVDGILSADPAILKKFGRRAILIPKMTYGEYEELGYGGFQVLHRDITVPVSVAGIPLRVLNPEKLQSDPSYQGSLIVASREITRDEDVIGIAGMNGFAALKISKRGMERDRGIARRILQIIERSGISISHVPTEIDVLTVIFDEKQLVVGNREDEIREEIVRKIRPTEMRLDSVGILSAVGLGIRGHRTRVARILFSALDKAGIEQLGGMQGYDGISMTYVFNSFALEEAISVAHKALIEDRHHNSTLA